VLLAHKEIKVLPEFKVLKDQSAVKVFQVQQVSLPQDHLEFKGLKEMLVTKVLIVVVILQDPEVLKGRQGLKVLKDKVEDQVHKVHKERKDQQGQLVEQVLSVPHLTQE
jgi:hypothetical protein